MAALVGLEGRVARRQSHTAPPPRVCLSVCLTVCASALSPRSRVSVSLCLLTCVYLIEHNKIQCLTVTCVWIPLCVLCVCVCEGLCLSALCQTLFCLINYKCAC